MVISVLWTTEIILTFLFTSQDVLSGNGTFVPGLLIQNLPIQSTRANSSDQRVHKQSWKIVPGIKHGKRIIPDLFFKHSKFLKLGRIILVTNWQHFRAWLFQKSSSQGERSLKLELLSDLCQEKMGTALYPRKIVLQQKKKQ